MTFALAATVGALFAFGTFLVLRDDLVKVIWGLAIISQAANVYLVSMGGVVEGTSETVPVLADHHAPFPVQFHLDGAGSHHPAVHADPNPGAARLLPGNIDVALGGQALEGRDPFRKHHPDPHPLFGRPAELFTHCLRHSLPG